MSKDLVLHQVTDALNKNNILYLYDMDSTLEIVYEDVDLSFTIQIQYVEDQSMLIFSTFLGEVNSDEPLELINKLNIDILLGHFVYYKEHNITWHYSTIFIDNSKKINHEIFLKQLDLTKQIALESNLILK
jgi:hypothetical protein